MVCWNTPPPTTINFLEWPSTSCSMKLADVLVMLYFLGLIYTGVRLVIFFRAASTVFNFWGHLFKQESVPLGETSVNSSTLMSS